MSRFHFPEENQYSVTYAVQGNLGRCPICGGLGIKRERRPDGFDYCTNGHRYSSLLAKGVEDIHEEEFFEKHGLEVRHSEGALGNGLLAFPTGNQCTDPWALMNVPQAENGAFLTCYCNTRRELMVALSSAVLVANLLTQERNEAGRL